MEVFFLIVTACLNSCSVETRRCNSCGAEVQAEWDGGVELATNEPE